MTHERDVLEPSGRMTVAEAVLWRAIAPGLKTAGILTPTVVPGFEMFIQLSALYFRLVEESRADSQVELALRADLFDIRKLLMRDCHNWGLAERASDLPDAIDERHFDEWFHRLFNV